MAGRFRQIQKKIESIRSITKITRAMELVAASRIVKAQHRLIQARPYARGIQEAIRELAGVSEVATEFPLLKPRDEIRTIGIVVITSDRGLAGSYNSNVIRHGVNLIREIAGAPPLPPGPESEGPALTELDRAVDILVEMKNSAEAAVGLAYSSLLFNDAALAAEVTTLETRSDTLEDELESWVLRAAPEARHPDELRGILRIGYASESIFDAARDMTWLVEQGEELHPVVAMALEESEEVATETVVERGSRADGHSLKELQVQTETGMHVLAVQRGRRWIYRPRPRFELEAGDRVISIGPEAGAEELEALCTVPAWAVPAE